MCTVLLIGSDPALLEGLSQTLASAGHRPLLAAALGEGAEIAFVERPLVAVVERRLAGGDAASLLRLPIAPGGSVVLYRDADEERPALPAALERATLADLALPLERARLVALVHHVEGRANAVGRGRVSTPTEVPRVR